MQTHFNYIFFILFLEIVLKKVLIHFTEIYKI